MMKNPVDFRRFRKNKDHRQKEIDIEMEGRGGIIDTFCNDTEEWQEAHS